MKAKFYALMAATLLGTGTGISAESIILDLSKSTTPLTFSSDTGAATITYDDDTEEFESQCFVFGHNSIVDWNTWWGFTASNSADNSNRTALTYQWSNMAKGGLALADDGTVKVDEDGQPVVSADMPYLVAYYSDYMSARPVDMTFNDDRLYDAKSVYVNLNTYAYYSMLDGDSFARAFRNGDKFTLTIHGVKDDDTEKTVDVSLASYTNGDLTTTRGWKKVDLTELSAVKEIYFTMASTDSGAYGMNTPAYFCMDKLEVAPYDDSAVKTVRQDYTNAIQYSRQAGMVRLNGEDFAVVYNVAGQKVKVVEGNTFSVNDLPSGVYMVKTATSALKIAK